MELEGDSNQSGQTWKVRVRDNDGLVVKTRATDLSSGQVCVGQLTL